MSEAVKPHNHEDKHGKAHESLHHNRDDKVISSGMKPEQPVDDLRRQEVYDREKHPIAAHYENICQDPRYLRLLLRYAPGIFKAKYIKQRAKLFIDPANIPVVGMGVKIHRAVHMQKNTGKLGMVDSTLEKHDVPEISASSQDLLTQDVKNARVGNEKETRKVQTGAVLSSLFYFFPIGVVIPGFAEIPGKIFITPAKIAAGAAAKKKEQALVNHEQKKTDNESQDRKNVAEANISDEMIHFKYGATRAFLKYLGSPKDDNPLYAHFEPSRLAVKKLYGANPEDDLYEMKPKGELLKKLRKMELLHSSYDMSQLEGVPVLLLLFRAFDCWDIPYYAKIAHGVGAVKYKIKKEDAEEERYKKHVEKDEATLQEKALEHDDGRFHLRSFDKEDMEVVNAYFKSLLTDHPLLDPLIKEEVHGDMTDKEVDKVDDRLNWFSSSLAGYFVKKQESWGCFDEQGELQALVLWKKNNAKPVKMHRRFGKFKLLTSVPKVGKASYKAVQKQWVDLDEAGDVIDSAGAYLVAFKHTDTGHAAVRKLLIDLLHNSSGPFFVTCHQRDDKLKNVLKEMEFKDKYNGKEQDIWVSHNKPSHPELERMDSYNPSNYHGNNAEAIGIPIPTDEQLENYRNKEKDSSHH